MTESQGVKFDQGKLRYDLVPLAPLEMVAQILTHGAEKYGERNWEQGINYSRLYAATMRHITAFWGGEDIDPDSGLPHAAHAVVNLMFVLHFWAHPAVYHCAYDDRP